MEKTRNKKVIIISIILGIISIIPFFNTKNSFADEVTNKGNSYYIGAQRLYNTTSTNNQFDISVFNKEDIIKENNGITFESNSGDLQGTTLDTSVLKFSYQETFSNNGIIGFKLKLREVFPSAQIGLTYKMKYEESNVNINGIYLYQANKVWYEGENLTINESHLNSDFYVYAKNKNFKYGTNAYTTSYIKGISIYLSNVDYGTWTPSPTTYYNKGYIYGYEDGNTAGQETGEEIGYNNGYNNGYTEGYNDGSNGIVAENTTLFTFYQNIWYKDNPISTNENEQELIINGTNQTVYATYLKNELLFNTNFNCIIRYDEITSNVNFTYKIGYADVNTNGTIKYFNWVWESTQGTNKEIMFPNINELTGNATIYIEFNLGEQIDNETPPRTTIRNLRLLSVGSIETIYQAGINQGYKDGYNNGFEEGVETEQKNSYNKGYNAGIIAGAENANEYTFLGLISATIDAPIKAITGLFNFEILGFNMSSLIMALFTLFIIIAILRVIL